MNLIKLNGYIPPAPTQYDVDFGSVNGEKSQTEDGYTYIEQVRADVPTIKVGWTNLTQEEVTKITDELVGATVDIDYFYGTERKCEMTVSTRSLKLKSIDNSSNTYWNLSFTLEG